MIQSSSTKYSPFFSKYPCQMDICFSEKCNMNCDYCFVDKSNPAVLNFSTIKKAIDMFYCFTVKHRTITLTTTESLIYPELTKKTLNYIFSAADTKKIEVNVILTTNGVLLGASVRRFIDSLDNRFQLDMSWDGKPASHNAHRKLRGSAGKGKTKPKAFDLAFRNYSAIHDKNKPRVIFTIAPSEAGRLAKNVEFIIKNGFKKIDLFPQMLCLWSKKDLIKLEKEMKKVISKFNKLKGYDLRLLNRLWGHSHYNKVLLGCDGKFYLYEMILVINHKKRKPYVIGGTNKGIDLKKRLKMFNLLFSVAEECGGYRCSNCYARNICSVPLPLLIWCKTNGHNFKQYLDSFCRISQMFVKLSKLTKENIKNRLDSKKLAKLRTLKC